MRAVTLGLDSVAVGHSVQEEVVAGAHPPAEVPCRAQGVD